MIHPKLKTCWFRGEGGCDGRLDRAHWIKQQTIKKQYPHGPMRCVETGEWRPRRKNEPESTFSGGFEWELVPVSDVVWDDRVWSYVCRRHHFLMDNHVFRPVRADLPVWVWEFAREHGLVWCLERDYPLEVEDDGPAAA